MLDMIERLLLEADLEDQLPKLEVIVLHTFYQFQVSLGRICSAHQATVFANFELFFKKYKNAGVWEDN